MELEQSMVLFYNEAAQVSPHAMQNQFLYSEAKTKLIAFLLTKINCIFFLVQNNNLEIRDV